MFYLKDKILAKWVTPKYLEQEFVMSCARKSLEQSGPTYTILDDFFNEQIFNRLIVQHKKLDFQEDDVNLPYDSKVVFGEEANSPINELLMSDAWSTYTRGVLGYEIGGQIKNSTAIKLRQHPEYAKGFWPHIDKNINNPAKVAVLIYMNEGWQLEDGAKFQIWKRTKQDVSNAEFKIEELIDQRLSFLEGRKTMTIEAASFQSYESCQLELIKEVEPFYNRVVICDIESDPFYHSVTPSQGKIRYAITQWLY